MPSAMRRYQNRTTVVNGSRQVANRSIRDSMVSQYAFNIESGCALPSGTGVLFRQTGESNVCCNIEE